MRDVILSFMKNQVSLAIALSRGLFISWLEGNASSGTTSNATFALGFTKVRLRAFLVQCYPF